MTTLLQGYAPIIKAAEAKDSTQLNNPEWADKIQELQELGILDQDLALVEFPFWGFGLTQSKDKLSFRRIYHDKEEAITIYEFYTLEHAHSLLAQLIVCLSQVDNENPG